MFRSALIAIFATLALCQAASAQGMSQYDSIFDYKIEIRQRVELGKAVYYDTHRPITNPLHQVNRKWRTFQSAAEADTFFAANPSYEILDQHSTWIDETEWIEVDLVGTYNQAMDRELELRLKSWSIETRVKMVYIPFVLQANGWAGF